MGIAEKMRSRSEQKGAAVVAAPIPVSTTYPDGVVTDSQRRAYDRGIAAAHAATQTALEDAG